MTLTVKDASGSSINLATGSGDGSGAPFKSPAATGIGDVADSAVTNPASSGSIIALAKGLLTKLAAQLPAALGQTTMSASLPVAIASNQSAVPVSAASLPLPTGASTAAKQPALGTAGSASTDVISVQGIASMTPLAVTPGATENHLGEVGGKMVIASATITRPANTTQYTAGDTITGTSPALLTFSSAFRVNSGTGYVVKAQLTKNNATTTAALFRLHLWKATPSFSVASDNAAFTLLYADVADHLGYIDFTSFATEGSGSDCVTSLVVGSGLPLAAFALSGAQTLKGLLVAEDVYTPASGEQFTITLTIDQN